MSPEKENQELFNYLMEIFGHPPLETEMDEIVRIVEKIKKQEDDGLPSYEYPQENCPHHNTEIKVVGGSLGCETTVIACVDCGKHMTEAETDC